MAETTREQENQNTQQESRTTSQEKSERPEHSDRIEPLEPPQQPAEADLGRLLLLEEDDPYSLGGSPAPEPQPQPQPQPQQPVHQPQPEPQAPTSPRGEIEQGIVKLEAEIDELERKLLDNQNNSYRDYVNERGEYDVDSHRKYERDKLMLDSKTRQLQRLERELRQAMDFEHRSEVGRREQTKRAFEYAKQYYSREITTAPKVIQPLIRDHFARYVKGTNWGVSSLQNPRAMQELVKLFYNNAWAEASKEHRQRRSGGEVPREGGLDEHSGQERATRDETMADWPDASKRIMESYERQRGVNRNQTLAEAMRRDRGPREGGR